MENWILTGAGRKHMQTNPACNRPKLGRWNSDPPLDSHSHLRRGPYGRNYGKREMGVAGIPRKKRSHEDLTGEGSLPSTVKMFRPKKEGETLNPKSDKSSFVWKTGF
jgi:hypothetical protein